MKRTILMFTGALALVPTLAFADNCRDCRRGEHASHHGHYHHDHRAAKAWAKARREHAREHRRDYGKGYHKGYHKNNHKNNHRGYREQVSSPAYGRVVDVEPVYRVYTQAVQDTACLQPTTGYSTRTNWAPAVLGAVIGGAVGHRVGDAHGDADAAAIAGGLLGAAIGRDVALRERDSRAVSVRGPCRSVEREQRSLEPVEYVVTYRYNGQVYRTHMDRHPGEWVELDVNIKPV